MTSCLSFFLTRCLSEVNEKIDTLKLPGEPKELAMLHEDHRLFRQERDEQLLLWTQRSESNMKAA